MRNGNQEVSLKPAEKLVAVGTKEKLREARGFTLLEVMIALVIAAVALTAISGSHTSSVIHSVKVYRMTTAAMLMRGIVLDVEEEYQVEGFPSNDVEGRDCDIPKPFNKSFECEYDLQGMEFGEGELAALSEGAVGGFMGGEDPSALMGGGAKAPGAMDEFQAAMDPSMLPGLAMIFGPGGEEILHMCSINLSNVLMSVMGITQYFPQIVQKAAEQTRKLTVRITWEEGFRNDRTFEVETFIVVIPEDQKELMKLMGRAEDAGLLDAPEEGSPLSPFGGAGGGGGRGTTGGGR